MLHTILDGREEEELVETMLDTSWEITKRNEEAHYSGNGHHTTPRKIHHFSLGSRARNIATITQPFEVLKLGSLKNSQGWRWWTQISEIKQLM